MCELAQRLGPRLAPPLVVWLQGDLGAGKTTFVRGLLQGLGHQGRVKSPTYGLLEHYRLAGCQVLHLDLYRIADSGELEFLGISDLIDSQTILMVEWPQNGGPLLPRPDLEIHIHGSGSTRELEFRANGDSGMRVLAYLETLLS